MVEEVTTLENGALSDHDHDEGLSEIVNREVNEKNSIPLGDYCLVGWDLDTTGRRLLDEIVHISAYTENDSFSLYVMPHGDISVRARRRHMIRIVNVGLYRIIKDNINNKVLKTKSEISAIGDFLEWLENVCKNSGKSGILLICHEVYKFNPYLFIKSLKEYNLLERFQNVVKGFVDCHNFAKMKCEKTMVNFSIRILSKVLLAKDNVEIFKASDRARLAYEIVQHLCAGASEIGTGAASPNEEIIKCILPFTMSIEAEHETLNEMKITINRQNTFKPIFRNAMRFLTPLRERRIALQLRKYLVDALIDYDMLKTCWADKGKEGLEELLKEKLSSIPEKDHEALLKVLVEHFENPDAPKPRYSRPAKNFRGRQISKTPESANDVEHPPVAVAVN